MRNTLLAIAAIAMTGTPLIAQDAMSGDAMKAKPMKKMSATDMKKMKSCQAMTHARMMKNAGCKKMMQMHPDMMKGDMMKSGT